MGSELVNSSTSHFSFTEAFERACPHFMAMGMTYDEFWNSEPDRVKYYREAEEIRQKKRDYDLWLQGRYFYDALCAVSPILHAFAKGGTQAEPFNEEPYPRTMKDYKESMKGVHSTCISTGTLDEAPMAYKSGDEIKELILPTAEIIDHLKPVYNFKAS